MSDLTVEKLPIESVIPHPDNPRVGDVEALAESLKRFGQVKPIVVQASTRHVIAGNHTRMAGQSLGWTEIAAVVLDVDDETAVAYLLADNRLSDRAKYDETKLYELLEAQLDLDGTGYDLDYVESLADAIGANQMASTDTGEVQKVKVEVPQPRQEKQQAKAAGEAMRDVVMLMTVSEAQAFGAKVAALQKHYGTTTVVSTVRKAVEDAASAAEAI